MLALLGSILGFFSSSLPNILDYFQDKSDKKHELDMMTKTAEIEKDKAIQLAEIKAESAERRDVHRLKRQEMDHDLEVFDALNKQNELLNERDKPTGNAWIDKLRASVRPFITYWWMLLYTGVKAATVYYVLFDPAAAGLPLMDKVQLVWTENDIAVFATIITFWFGHKMNAKHKNPKA